jgi:hypothetical protein
MTTQDVEHLDRVVSLAQRLQVPEIMDRAAVLRAAAREDAPVVCLVGATGRGKSRLAALCAEAEGAVSLTSPSVLQQAVQAFLLKGEQESGEPDTQPILLLEAPALDTASNRGRLADCIARTDLLLMVVQLTQPAGYVEVEFARESLSPDARERRAIVMVLTKADMVDEEDFADATEAIWTAYRDLGCQEIVIAGRGLSHDNFFGRPLFEEWWPARGRTLAMQASCEQRAFRMEDMLRVIEAELRQRGGETERALAAIQRRSEMREQCKTALDLQERLRTGLAEIPDRLAADYQERLPELRIQLENAIDMLLGGTVGKQDAEANGDRFGEICIEWDKTTRARIRRAVQPEMDGLMTICADYQDAVSAVCTENEIEIAEPSLRQRAALEADDFQIEKPRLSRTQEEQGKDQMIASSAGLGAILLAVAVGLSGTMPILTIGIPVMFHMQRHLEEKRRTALRAEARITMLSQISTLETDLLRRFHDGWCETIASVESQIAPWKRALNSLLLLDRSLQAEEDGDNGQAAALLAKQQEVEAMLDELAALRRGANTGEETE